MDHEEFGTLLDYMLPQAQDLLGKTGDFAPFAAALNGYGTVDTVTGQAGDGVSSDRDIMDLLVKTLRHHASPRSYRATGICYSARVRQPEQEEPFLAIAVALEHVEGGARVVYLPYEKGPDGSFTYGIMVGSESDPKVFDRSKEN